MGRDYVAWWLEPQAARPGPAASYQSCPTLHTGHIWNSCRVAGERCIPEAAHQLGEGYSIQANMMTTDTVVLAMVAAYERAQGDLTKRMMAAL